MATTPCHNPSICGVVSHVIGSDAAKHCARTASLSVGAAKSSPVPVPRVAAQEVKLVEPSRSRAGSITWARMSPGDSFRQWESGWSDEQVITAEEFVSHASEQALVGGPGIAAESVNITWLTDGSAVVSWAEEREGAGTYPVHTVTMNEHGRLFLQGMGVADWDDAEWKSDQQHRERVATQEKAIRRQELVETYGLTSDPDHEAATVTLDVVEDDRVEDKIERGRGVRDWAARVGEGKVSVDKAADHSSGNGHPRYTFYGDYESVFALLDAYDRGE